MCIRDSPKYRCEITLTGKRQGSRNYRDRIIGMAKHILSGLYFFCLLYTSPAALSYHLKLLKGVDLISEYKEKNFIYYEINTTVFDELIIWVNQFGGKK